MPAETIMPLTFATFFICGVKELTNLHQRICVNVLLKGMLLEKNIKVDACEISDPDCSNYAKGKRKLSTEIQIELSTLNLEEIIERIKRISIRNLTTAADALKILVKNSSLSEKDKEALLKNYREDQELTFIAKVFLRSVKEDNSQELTLTQRETLIKYRDYNSLLNDKNGILIHEHQKQVNEAETDLHANTEIDEDISWMDRYVPASMVEKPFMPDDSEVIIRHDEIKLPEEYARMVYLLKPALREANIRKLPMNTFIEVLDIDAASNSLREGQIEYWQFEGAIDAIAALFKKLNFLDACGFVIQPIGNFEIEQTQNMEEILKSVSNANVAMCSPLIYKDTPDFKLVLLVHKSKRKAKEQKLDTEHDHTRIYERKR